jgi:hypothetical protein
MAYEYKKWTPDEETAELEKKANSYGTYNESQSVSDLRNKKNEYEANNNPGEWKGGTYGDAVKDAYNAFTNREKFTYDLNGDALYQQYKDKYINQGRLAMADTIGQASAMTGGYGNSYATTAGSQAYQSQLQNLNDIVPQLYQMAYDRYNQEGEDLKTNYSMLSNLYNTEYGEHRDKVGDYNTALDRITSEYNNERSFDYGKWDADRSYYQTAYQNAYNRDYGAHQDEQKRLYQEARDAVADAQWQASYELQKEAANKATETNENVEGLSLSDSQKLQELYVNKDWDAINRYIVSLDLSESAKAHIAEIWLPEDYRNPPEIEPPKKSGGAKGGGIGNPIMHTLN